MDHTRDNPLKRFTAFWIAILLVFCFGVALILLRPLTHRDGTTASDLTSKSRLEVKRDLDRAQNEALDDQAHQEAVEASLASFSEQTVRKGDRPVPPETPPASSEKTEDQTGDASDAGEPTESGDSSEDAPSSSTTE